MQRFIGLLLLITIALGNGNYHQNQILIYIDNNYENLAIVNRTGHPETGDQELDEFLATSGAVAIRRWLRTADESDHDGDIYLNRYYLVDFGTPRNSIANLRLECQQVPIVARTELVPVIKPHYTPNDPRFGQQWHLPNVRAPQAWDLWDVDGGDIPGTNSTREIKVGVVDTGVDWTHPDLVDNIWNNLGEDANGNGVTILQSGNSWILDPGDLNGIDDDNDGYIDDLVGWDTEGSQQTNGDNDPFPPSVGMVPDHGTNVSGAVSGVTNNSLGIAGTGWGLSIIAVKIANDTNGDLDGGYDGILYAAKAGADVINCSWGGSGYSGGGQAVINTAHNTYGAVIVASSGNGNEAVGLTNLDTHYPSGYDNVISVTATGTGDSFNCWATAGTTVDLGAPGETVWTTDLNDGYEAPWGTSFSAPIVAGAAGLVWSYFPDEDNVWIEDRIINATDTYSDMDRNCQVQDLGETSPHTESMTGMLGTGRLNVYKALTSGIYPSLSVQSLNLQGDTDSDGIFNPGETVNIKVVVENDPGWATATSVLAVLATDDDRITVIDNLITFNNDIPAGQSTFNLFDSFQISADAEASTGPVEFTVAIYAGDSPNEYYTEDHITVDIELQMANFPYFAGAAVKTSPLATDLNGDGQSEIYFGADNFKIYGVGVDGLDITSYPFSTGNQVRSSVAVGDVDNDGDLELVFGSKDRNLYILNSAGTADLEYVASGFLMHTPALFDMDDDGDLEIIFGSTIIEAGVNSGKVHAIHHDGSDVAGYPIEVGEVIMAAPAVGDIDADGEIDVVVGTWGNSLFAVSAGDSIKTGFPYTTGNRINVAPVIGNILGDASPEIIAGSDDGNVYILNNTGGLEYQIGTGQYIRGGFALCDVTADGYAEIFWGGYDSKLHAFDVNAGGELTGWPVNVGTTVASAPVLVDINNDGALNVIGASTNGQVLGYHLDGSALGNFPVTVEGSIESSPAVQDIDSDNDFDILVGTSNGLAIIDYKQAKSDETTWRLFRGSMTRAGNINAMYLATEERLADIPEEIYVSPGYPNPFNPTTMFDIHIPRTTAVRAQVFDIRGRLVKELADQRYTAGIYHLEWNGRDHFNRLQSSGVYLVRVAIGSTVSTHKVLLVK